MREWRHRAGCRETRYGSGAARPETCRDNCVWSLSIAREPADPIASHTAVLAVNVPFHPGVHREVNHRLNR